MTQFDPHEFFQLGQDLTSAPYTEARCRTAISRAYYSCFISARDKLFGMDARGLTNERQKRVEKLHQQAFNLRRPARLASHETVIFTVKTMPIVVQEVRSGWAKNLADQMSQLKAMRVQADYFRDSANEKTMSVFQTYQVTDWAGLAHHAMSMASSIIADVRRLPSFP